MKELVVTAKKENLEKIIPQIQYELEQNHCPYEERLKIEIAIEEIYMNIVHYAYPFFEGKVTVQYEIQQEEKKIMVRFLDQGIPYNPLKRQDPEIQLDSSHRKIGGLGVYIVKKSMDHVSYLYKDHTNILTIEKSFHA